MSRVIYLHPNPTLRDEERRLFDQIRLYLWTRHCASMDMAPSNAPWTGDWLRAAPFTGAIVWNGYGPRAVVDHVTYCEWRTRKPVLRVENGWLPQAGHYYFSHGLGAYSTLAGEIEQRRWPFDWGANLAWALGLPRTERPALPDGYVLVTGQVPNDSNLVSISVPPESIAQLVRDSTSRPVVYRPHPRHPEPTTVTGVINTEPGSDLRQQLEHAYCVVSGTSTTLLEAASFGTPALSLGIGVWSNAMVRNCTGLTLKHELARADQDWDAEARRYGIAVLRQQAQVSLAKPRFSERMRSLLQGLI